MKLPDSLTKPAGFITAGIIIVLVVLAGAGFWLNFKNSRLPAGNSSTPTSAEAIPSGETIDIRILDKPQEASPTTLNIDSWKEYKDPSQKFMIQFPQSWKVTFEQSSLYKDKMDINIEGPEGWVNLMWADSYGGACEKEDGSPGYETIEFKSGKEQVCHQTNFKGEGKQNNTEFWQLQKQFRQNEPEGIYLNAYAYNKASEKEFANRDVLLKIIKTMNIAR